MSNLHIRDIELEALHLGEGQKRTKRNAPLLVLHGANGPATLAPTCRALAAHFEVLAPHHPGFGGSPVAAGIDSIDDLSYLYLDLLEARDLRGVTLMGFSMGGWIAAEMAVKSTARIARLILVDAVGIRVPGRADCEIADLFNIHPAKIPPLAFHDPSRAPDPAKMSADEQLAAARAREAAARYTWEPYMHNPKLAGRLHRIGVPTLVVWGAHDGIVPPAYGKEYCALIPGARMKVFDRSGHAPQVEQPGEFIAEIVDFAAPAAV